MRIIAPVGGYDVAVSREHLALTNDLEARIDDLLTRAENYFISRIESKYGFDKMNLGELVTFPSEVIKKVYLSRLAMNTAPTMQLVKATANEIALANIEDCKIYEVVRRINRNEPKFIFAIHNPQVLYSEKARVSISSVCRVYMTWGVQRPSKEALRLLAETHGPGVPYEQLLFIHVPSAADELDRIQSLRRMAGIDDTLIPLLSARMADLKQQAPKAKRVQPKEKTFVDLAARYSRFLTLLRSG